jgi:hypothetical protein
LIKITPFVNTVDLEMELDTRVGVSVIPEKVFEQKFPNAKLKPSDIVLKTYSGQKMKPVGLADVRVKYQNQVHWTGPR